MYDEKRFSIINFLIILAVSLVQYEFVIGFDYGDVRCAEREKEALIGLKKGLIDDNGILSSWGSEDCCKWEGVKCSNTTGHVTGLYLHNLGGNLSSNLLELHHLEVLDLSRNDFGMNTIPEFICSMVQLKHLDLSWSSFVGIVPHQIGNLTNLKTLDLSFNHFGGSKIPESIFSMVQLQYLNLSWSDFSGVVPHQIGNLTNLKTLDLSDNDFGKSKIPESICSMVQLQHLDLSWSNFSGIVPHQIGNLTNLKTLDLSLNDFGKSKIPESICSMVQLQHLDLSWSNFSGIVPHQIGNLTNLKTLDLSSNHFGGSKIPESIGSMTELKELNLHDTGFSGIVPPHLGNLTNLQTLDLSHRLYHNSLLIDNIIWLDTHLPLLSRLDFSYVKITDPNCLQYVLNLPSLRKLNLHNCGLIDSIKPSPDVFVNLSSSTSSLHIFDLSNNELTLSTIIELLLNNRTGPRLEHLDVSFNSLEGTITESELDNLHNLDHLDLSYNSLVLRVNHNWTPPFQLHFIILGDCNMGPHFPLWLRTQNNMEWLDLSSSGLTGEVPEWFYYLSHSLTYLNISNNHLSGIVHDFSPEYIDIIDLSSNEFSGPIPLLSPATIPLFPPATSVLQLSQNMFSGSVSSICALRMAYLIDLSNNMLVGELPNCWENMTELTILNLANNSLSGEIPLSLGSILSLTILQLGNNNLSGELPSTLKNCTNLQLIDVRDNMIAGNIPTWIGAYEYVAYLIFSNNRFEGIIPPHICNLTYIQVLDLSGNHLSGKIPPCFNTFTLLVQMNPTMSPFEITSSSFGPNGDSKEYVESAIVSWKGREFKYRRNLAFLKLIDLSSNRLVGEIPKSFSSLRGLSSLNLSRNSLTGNINPDIGQMTMLETLDLSSNHLSGVIPIGMTQLNFLAVLNLANNNLSGKIPIGRQLQTFNASSYAGNIGLCGSPLPLCPGDSPRPSANNKARDIDDEKDDDGILNSSFFMDIVISIALGFILGFWGAVGSLIVKESWRRSFFNFWGAVGDWLYVTANIFWAKFRGS